MILIFTYCTNRSVCFSFFHSPPLPCGVVPKIWIRESADTNFVNPSARWRCVGQNFRRLCSSLTRACLNAKCLDFGLISSLAAAVMADLLSTQTHKSSGRGLPPCVFPRGQKSRNPALSAIFIASEAAIHSDSMVE